MRKITKKQAIELLKKHDLEEWKGAFAKGTPFYEYEDKLYFVMHHPKEAALSITTMNLSSYKMVVQLLADYTTVEQAEGALELILANHLDGVET